MKILLSAGHGGTDSGSIGADRRKEKDRTLDLANRVASILRNAGHSVTVNTEKTVFGRWRFKNKNGYDYALSIHFNAFNGSATGTECFYKGTQKKASELSSKVASVLGVKNRGAKATSSLYMMNIGFDNLIEVCFHDNGADLAQYNANIDKVASAIANVIANGKVVSTVTTTSKPSSNVTGEIIYQSYDNKNKKWWGEVSSFTQKGANSYAGVLNNPMGGLRAKLKYGEIIIQTHIKGGGWLPKISSKAYSKNSRNGNSYSGIMGKPIDGVKIWSTKGHVDYRVYVKGQGWLPWVNSKNASGTGANSYAGIYGREICAIQMK